MAAYSAESIKKHPLFDSLKQFIVQFSHPTFADTAIFADPSNAYRRDRIVAMVHAIQALATATPVELTSHYALSQLNNKLAEALNEIVNFNSNRNVSHIHRAIALIEENVLPLTTGFLTPHANVAAISSSATMESYSAISSAAIAEFQKQRDNLKDSQARLKKEVAQLSEEIKKMEEVLTRERAEAGATIARLEKQYIEDDTKRAIHFREQLDYFNTKFDDAQAANTQRTEVSLTSLEKSAADARKLLQLTESATTTSHYQRIAISEHKTADLWRLITLMIFLGGALMAILTFHNFIERPIDLNTVLSSLVRLLIALAVIAPAFYTAREAARHRTTADRARQTELELASLGPFLEFMPDDKKAQIREKLSDQYFGKQVESHTAPTPYDLSTVKELVVAVINASKKS